MTPLPLFGYQAQAAELMAQHERFGLHDEMGIGKTATTIGAMDRAGVVRAVIVCPAMLRENWRRELARFSTIERRVCKSRNIHDFVAWSRGRFDVLIASYEQATKWTPKFLQDGELIDAIVFDEAHYLKNIKANRTKALMLNTETANPCMVDMACNAWHVTGTPMSNDPMDIYAFVRFAKTTDLPPDEFSSRYFSKREGMYSARHTPRDEMVPELRNLIYSRSIRRNHDDVGMELPPIWMNELHIEGSTIDINKAMEAYPHLEEVIVNAIESGRIDILSMDHIAVVRRLVGKAKAVVYADMLKQELDAGADKRIVFCWHTEPLLHVRNHLRKHGYDAVVAYGGSSENERIEAVHRFMNDPDCKVFIGNIRVAGTGLTLTASCKVDMLESDWSPAGNAQAIKRAHRYGQKRSVTARFITLAGSIDVAVNHVVADKTRSIAAIEGSEMTAAPLDTI